MKPAEKVLLASFVLAACLIALSLFYRPAYPDSHVGVSGKAPTVDCDGFPDTTRAKTWHVQIYGTRPIPYQWMTTDSGAVNNGQRWGPCYDVTGVPREFWFAKVWLSVPGVTQDDEAQPCKPRVVLLRSHPGLCP